MIALTTLWVAAVVLLLFFVARTMRTAHRALRCPVSGTEARVTYLETLPELRPIMVTACSEFTPDTAITCERQCLDCWGAEARPNGGARKPLSRAQQPLPDSS